MSTEMQTKMQASPVQNFTPVQTGLLQRKSALCNTPGLVEDSGLDKEKLTLQRSSIDQVGTTRVPPIVHGALRSPGHPIDLETYYLMEPRFGHDFSKLRVHSVEPGMIQTKLKINEPGDIYEQEADKVAEQVMRMAEPQVQRQPEEELVQTKPVITPLIQRHIDEEIEEEEEEFLQTKELPGQSPEVTPALSSRIQSLKGGGQALPKSVRAYFEPRFGHDFSQVKVHTGTKAAEVARAVNARAFTVGRDVFFGEGEYMSGTSTGRRLILHELTHVVQQGSERIHVGHINEKRGLFPIPDIRKLSIEAFLQRACLPDSECKLPEEKVFRVGSAKDFSKEMDKKSKSKRNQVWKAQSGLHGQRAKEVEKLFKKHLPDLQPLIRGVFVDETLPEYAGARHKDCLKWAEEILSPLSPKENKTEFEGATRTCVFVPKKLEQNAKEYNRQGKAKQKDMEWWLKFRVLSLLTHEVTHARFLKIPFSYPAGQNCTEEEIAHELSELAASISEFPFVNPFKSDILKAWLNSKLSLEDPSKEKRSHQSIAGSIRDIRCSCECVDADALIRKVFRLVSYSWTEDEKREFHAHMKRGKGKELGVYWPYALFARAIAKKKIPSRFVHAIGGTVGLAFGAESGWSASLYWEITWQRPVVRLVNPSFRLSVTMLGFPEKETEEGETNPTSATLVGFLGGIRIENPRPQGGNPYFSLFGGPTLNFIPGSGGEDWKWGLEAGVGAGYRWSIWDVGIGATYRYNPAAPEGFEHTFQVGPTIMGIIAGKTR